MIGGPGSPIAAQRLLELQRARSTLVIDLLTWPSGARGVSFGYTSSDLNRSPLHKTKFTSITPDEIEPIVYALQEALARIQDERDEEPTP